MSVFLDTSAIIALLDANERKHEGADAVWRDLIERDEDIVCTNYVLVETCAVAQRRLGIESIRGLMEDAMPVLRVVWIGESEHQRAVTALLAANRRQLSLVDCTSFDTMRRLGIRTVFAFDEHFAEQGFECIPTPE